MKTYDFKAENKELIGYILKPNTMKTYDFNIEERAAIGEFVFSHETDILIKSDAISVVAVLLNHDIIDEQIKNDLVNGVNKSEPGFVSKISGILLKNITDQQGREIMDEYLGSSKKTPQNS